MPVKRETPSQKRLSSALLFVYRAENKNFKRNRPATSQIVTPVLFLTWNLPTEAILTTLSAVELFLGAIFGISKVIYDRKENSEKDL